MFFNHFLSFFETSSDLLDERLFEPHHQVILLPLRVAAGRDRWLKKREKSGSNHLRVS